MATIMLGIPRTRVLEVQEDPGGVRIEIETTGGSARCAVCGGEATFDGTTYLERPGLPVFGRPVVLSWRLRRWKCPRPGCAAGSWTEEAPERSARNDAVKQ